MAALKNKLHGAGASAKTCLANLANGLAIHKILSLILSTFFLFSATAAHAAGGNLVGFIKNYDPVIDYRGNVVRYWISPELRSAVFTLGEHSYRRDIGSVIVGQVNQWSAWQNIMIFEPAANERDANLIFRSTSTLPPAVNCELAQRAENAAVTFRPGVSEAAGVVAFSIDNAQRALTCLIEQTGKDPGDMLDLALNGDASHEIGHVLGFDHPEEIGRSYVEYDRYWTRGLSEEEQEEEAEIPHLMTADAGNYLREMEALLQRPMMTADIRPSPIELGALRLRGERLARERAHQAAPANFCMPHTSSFERFNRVASFEQAGRTYDECIADVQSFAGIAANSLILLN